jgi:hypothetical protein
MAGPDKKSAAKAPAQEKPAPKDKAAAAAPAKTEAKTESKTEAKTEAKAEAKNDAKTDAKPEAAPSNYSRGEGQKVVSQAYKDNWNDIFGKKSKKKKR